MPGVGSVYISVRTNMDIDATRGNAHLVHVYHTNHLPVTSVYKRIARSPVHSKGYNYSLCLLYITHLIDRVRSFSDIFRWRIPFPDSTFYFADTFGPQSDISCRRVRNDDRIQKLDNDGLFDIPKWNDNEVKSCFSEAWYKNISSKLEPNRYKLNHITYTNLFHYSSRNKTSNLPILYRNL